MDDEMQFRVRELEQDVQQMNSRIDKIDTDLTQIIQILNQCRWFITGGVLFMAADKIGFFSALGLVA
jgi:hypothetical protein